MEYRKKNKQKNDLEIHIVGVFQVSSPFDQFANQIC